MSLGLRIKELRLKRGFTQGEIAEKLGMGRSNFGHIENNRVIPSSKDLEIIADILQTTTDYLLGRTNDQDAKGYQQYVFNDDGSTRLLSVKETSELYESIDANQTIKVIKDQINAIRDDDTIIRSIKEKAINSLNMAVNFLGRNNISDDGFKPIPLIGTICAGDGLFAEENVEDFVTYPLVSKSVDFALRVKGDSMKNAGIDNDDIVFFKKTNWFDYNGQIVAVISEDNNGSLKRIKWNEKSMKFQLIPENENYEIKELAPTEFHICGVYAGHFKPDIHKEQ